MIALILLIRKITIYQSFVKYIKAGQISVSDADLLDKLASIGDQVNVKKAVELCVNPTISSPMLIVFSSLHRFTMSRHFRKRLSIYHNARTDTLSAKRHVLQMVGSSDHLSALV